MRLGEYWTRALVAAGERAWSLMQLPDWRPLVEREVMGPDSPGILLYLRERHHRKLREKLKDDWTSIASRTVPLHALFVARVTE